MVKVTLGLSFISDLIYDFQVDYRSKCRKQTIKVLEENNSGNLRLEHIQQSLQSSNHKDNTDILNYIKIKNLYLSKDNIKRE